VPRNSLLTFVCTGSPVGPGESEGRRPYGWQWQLAVAVAVAVAHCCLPSATSPTDAEITRVQPAAGDSKHRTGRYVGIAEFTDKVGNNIEHGPVHGPRASTRRMVMDYLRG
jgi:hypothetical protein